MFKRLIHGALFLLAFVGLSGSVSALKIAFPSYIYPGSDYNTITSSSAVQIVMFNPLSGPGTSVNSDYTAQLKKNKAAGKQTYGYLATGYFCSPSVSIDPTAGSPYADRCSITTIKEGIDKWASMYPGLDGIFFDEADTGKLPKSSSTQQEWENLISYASSKGMKSIINFGVDGFSSTLDNLNAIIVNYEGSAQNYLNTSFTHKGSKYYHIVYLATTTDEIKRVAAKASNIAGYVHISPYIQQSDTTGVPTAYNSLPSNWSEITNAVSGASGAVTTPTVTPGTETTPTTGTGSSSGGTTDPSKATASDFSPNPAACSGDQKCGKIADDIQLAVNVLSIGVGIVVTVMIVIAGLQYMLARDNPQAVHDAKTKLTNAIVAMISFVMLWAFLQWLVPGGLL